MNGPFENGTHANVGEIFPPVSGVEVLGTSQDEFGKRSVVVKHFGAEDNAAFAIESVYLINGNSKDLSRVLVDEGVNTPITKSPSIVRKDIVDQWELNKNKIIVFIDKPGSHQRVIGGVKYFILVINGGYHLPEPIPEDVSVILVGDAKTKHEKKKDYQENVIDLSEKLVVLPRLLLVMLFSLASYWWPVFGVPTLALMLVGKTSTGKSLSQGVASQLVKGTNRMISGNFTAIGLHDALAHEGTQPVFIEDGHGKIVAQAMLSAFMDAGNNAYRVRSKIFKSNKEAAKPVSATLVVSAEQDLMSSAKDANIKMNSGVLSRLFELHGGAHGMFDELCGFDDGASLAAYLNEVGSTHPGILGELMIQSICGNFQFYKKAWVNRKENITRQIFKYVEFDGSLDGQDARIFGGLVFCAFIGQIVAKEKHLLLNNKNINMAVGKLFGEYLVRKYEGDIFLAHEMHSSIKYVRDAINRNLRKFQAPKKGVQLRIQMKNSAVIGFEVDEKEGRYYLVKPEAFQEIMSDKLNQKTYQYLKKAGFLKTTNSRGNQYQKRLSGEDRKSFVAISKAILSD